MTYPWSAGEVLSASDLNAEFASKLPYSYGTATPSTTDNGFLWYDSNSTPAAPKFWDGAAFQALTSGKILQIVRATDATDRTTTSNTYVDASLSVTITPQNSTSAVLLMWTARPNLAANTAGYYQITDNSNNALSGAEGVGFYPGTTVTAIYRSGMALIGYSTPASTSALTYKARFRSNTSGVPIGITNSEATGQLYAIEVSA